MSGGAEERVIRALWIQTTKFGKNGITAVVMNYFSALPSNACRVDFVTLNPLPPDVLQQVEAQGGRSFVLPMRNKNPFLYLYRLTRIIRVGRYDVVHAHGNSATLAVEMIAAKCGGAPVRIAHSHNTSCTHGTLHKLLRRPFERALTCRMACGQEAGEWLFRAQPFAVLKNAVDTGRFAYSPEARERMRAQYGIGDAFTVGHAGAFTARKNHAFLVETFIQLAREHENCRLLLIGAGETMEQTRAALAEAGISDLAVFTGETDEVALLMSAMDAFVLPSLAEGLPVTLVEAQAAGLPCLTSDAVTRESDLTGLVSFLPLAAGANAWAAALFGMERQDRAAVSRAACQSIALAGYDIRQNGEKLLALYRAEAGKRI